MVVCEREAFFTVFDDHGTLHQLELMCYINRRVHIIRPVSHQTCSKLRERFVVFPSGTAYRAVVVSTVAVAGGCTMDLIIPRLESSLKFRGREEGEGGEAIRGRIDRRGSNPVSDITVGGSETVECRAPPKRQTSVPA